MIYGTAWKKDRTADLVEEAVLSGFRGIDTACQPRHYQEYLVGEGIARACEKGIAREELYLQTKFTPIDGQDRSNMPYLESDPLEVQIAKSFETSKRNLRTDFIDSYILHSPIFPASALLKGWETMSGFYHDKEVGQLGISNCYDLDVLKYLYERVEVKPSVVQNRFYAQSGYDRELREWCRERGIVYQSFWSLTANIHILEKPIFLSLSRKYGRSIPVIFYRFLSHLGIIPLNGTTTVEHMREDVKFDSFELNEDEVAVIEGMLR